MFEGKVEIFKKKKDEWKKIGETKNLFVDDGKELTLDFLFGLESWWNPKEQENYSGGDSGWDTVRYVAPGECMFNNASSERVAGTNSVQGSEWDYQVADTWLVSPEDSFLSSEISGSRQVGTITRRDQKVEISASFEINVDIQSGTTIREVGMFLSNSIPEEDPSLVASQRPNAMICRAVLWDSGYFDSSNTEHSSQISGAELCYKDDGYYVDSDVKLRWNFGEL